MEQWNKVKHSETWWNMVKHSGHSSQCPSIATAHKCRDKDLENSLATKEEVIYSKLTTKLENIDSWSKAIPNHSFVVAQDMHNPSQAQYADSAALPPYHTHKQ